MTNRKRWNSDRIIYLDPNFVAEKYQSVSGERPTTYLSTSQGRKTDGPPHVFAAEALSVETRSFPNSITEMLGAISDELEKYPAFDPSGFRNYSGTETGWVEGSFTMGEWRETKNYMTSDEVTTSGLMFEIKGAEHEYALLAQPQLFSANIGSLLTVPDAIRRYIGIPIRALGRALYYVEDANRFVFTPHLIVEAQEATAH